MSDKGLNGLSHGIIGIAIGVHKRLGTGFQEKIYEEALLREFEKSGIGYEKQKVIRVNSVFVVHNFDPLALFADILRTLRMLEL